MVGEPVNQLIDRDSATLFPTECISVHLFRTGTISPIFSDFHRFLHLQVYTHTYFGWYFGTNEEKRDSSETV